ncbi:MAG: hypothetical protein RIS20_1187 [Bacteroidota bacterium]|jgi:hypothetical protein
MKAIIYSFILLLLVSCGQGNERKLNEPQVKNHIGTTKERLVKSMIPKDYAKLTESPANGREIKRLTLDLDKDNQADTALIANYNDDFRHCILIVYLSSQDKSYQLKLVNEAPQHSFPVQLTSKNNVLEVGYFSDFSTGRYLSLKYEGKTKKLRLIGCKMGYSISLADHCDKSYNLISGDYTIQLQKSLPQKHVETFTGNVKSGPIYMSDFNLSVLKKLDQVGSKYELD